MSTGVLPSSNPSNQCIDSILKFRTRINEVEKAHYYSWVASGNETEVVRKCNYGGVSGHCPATCGSCGCYDSTLEFKIEWKGLYQWKYCEWASNSQVSDRCEAPDMFHTCRQICQMCTELPSEKPSSSPSFVASLTPTMNPSSDPSVSSSPSPSVTPSSQCIDSILKFRTRINEVEEAHYCSWVASGNETEVVRKCNYGGVSGHCPATCGSCGCYDSTLEFKIEWKGLYQWKYCEWASNSQVSDRCEAPDMFHTCRQICQMCTELPSEKPSSSPSFVASLTPTMNPSSDPSVLSSPSSSMSLSDIPSVTPSLILTVLQSMEPSMKSSPMPSLIPNASPSDIPSSAPSKNLSSAPSRIPSSKPSVYRSQSPSVLPSMSPSMQ